MIFYRIQVSLRSDLWVRFSITEWLTFWKLTDVTLADEDTNPILTDDANRTFQGNVVMQVTQLCCQIWYQAIVVKSEYANLKEIQIWFQDANSVIWWPNMQPMQMAPSGGQICNQCKWCHLVAKFGTNDRFAISWPNLELTQVALSGGEFCNLCKWPNLQPM